MKRLRLSMLLAVLAVGLSVTVVNAGVTTTFIPGNPECAGAKIEDAAGGDVQSGTYAVDFDGFAGTITITVHQTASGPTFDFVTDSPSHVVDSVIVKGGPNALLWTFDPPVSSATGLHAPLNVKNGKWYGLSHLCFETTKKSLPA